jgi:hypothetical protein
MSLDPAPVYEQRAFLDPPFPGLKVLMTELAYRHGIALSVPALGRVFARGDPAPKFLRLRPRLVRSDVPHPGDEQLSLLPETIPILEDIGFRARRLHPDAKALDLVVKIRDVTASRIGQKAISGSFGQSFPLIRQTALHNALKGSAPSGVPSGSNLGECRGIAAPLRSPAFAGLLRDMDTAGISMHQQEIGGFILAKG